MMNITLNFKVASICPIDKSNDVYSGYIEYTTIDDYIEINQFGAYLALYADEEYLCEDLAKKIYDDYNKKYYVNRVVLEENSPGIGIRVEVDG